MEKLEEGGGGPGGAHRPAGVELRIGGGQGACGALLLRQEAAASRSGGVGGAMLLRDSPIHGRGEAGGGARDSGAWSGGAWRAARARRGRRRGGS